jgi:hypothetical protein
MYTNDFSREALNDIVKKNRTYIDAKRAEAKRKNQYYEKLRKNTRKAEDTDDSDDSDDSDDDKESMKKNFRKNAENLKNAYKCRKCGSFKNLCFIPDRVDKPTFEKYYRGIECIKCERYYHLFGPFHMILMDFLENRFSDENTVCMLDNMVSYENDKIRISVKISGFQDRGPRSAPRSVKDDSKYGSFVSKISQKVLDKKLLIIYFNPHQFNSKYEDYEKWGPYRRMYYLKRLIDKLLDDTPDERNTFIKLFFDDFHSRDIKYIPVEVSKAQLLPIVLKVLEEDFLPKLRKIREELKLYHVNQMKIFRSMDSG